MGNKPVTARPPGRPAALCAGREAGLAVALHPVSARAPYRI